jgi:protein TonB
MPLPGREKSCPEFHKPLIFIAEDFIMMLQTMYNPANRVFAILPAALMTFGLLFLMYLLVSKDFGEVIEPPDIGKIDVFINEDDGTITTFTEMVSPVKPIPPEVQPVLEKNEPIEVDIDDRGPGLTTRVKPIPEVPVVGLNTGDQLMPFIKVQPNYPTTASSKGIEGYVDVAFDVATSGATENIRVINAVPSSIFNSSVIKAVKRWKYKPQIIEGAPVIAFDVRERITFELEKG